ncbi:MAG: M48 family metallopeptidase [Desulfobacterales bacterium]|nr:M48 family metallopeptidase [Desulfobacterales bacterium]
MNEYSLFVLLLLLGAFALETLAELLNLRALSPEPPRDCEDIYDPAEYRRSQEYTRVRTRFGFVASVFDLAILVGFWFAGGFELLDSLVRGWGNGPIVSGLFFITILALGKFLLSIPFSCYRTFVIEEQYGFNRSTVRTFVTDLLKTVFLSLLLGGALLALVLALFQYGGPGAWLYCWLATSLFLLVIQYIAPTWIMPWFNRFTPLADGELRTAILDYARQVNFSLANIFVMDGSRRSSKSNAFFTGFGRNRRIALFDTLIKNHTVKELVAVLAHEIGHYKKKHILQSMVLAILHAGILFFLLSLFLSRDELFAAFFVSRPSVYTGLVFFSLLFGPVELLLTPLLNKLSRVNEFAADRFAAKTLGGEKDLISALKKLSGQNLANLTPAPFYVMLHYSHPPLRQRLQALSRAGASLGEES